MMTEQNSTYGLYITTAKEEPWFTRGKSNSGRKPPLGACYTQVRVDLELDDFSKADYQYKLNSYIMSQLKHLTSLTGAHYLWYDVGKGVIEVWAHSDILQNVVKELKNIIPSYKDTFHYNLDAQRRYGRRGRTRLEINRDEYGRLVYKYPGSCVIASEVPQYR